MRTVFYKRAIAEAFRKTIDIDADTFYWQALTDDYVADGAAHDYLDDIDVAYRIGSPVAVTLTMSNDAQLGSNSPDVTDPADGDEIFQGVIYRAEASDATRLLILNYAAFREAPKISTGATMRFNLPAVLASFGR